MLAAIALFASQAALLGLPDRFEQSGFPGNQFPDDSVLELYSANLPAADVTATLAGTSTGLTVTRTNVYNFQTALPSSFSASAGTTY